MGSPGLWRGLSSCWWLFRGLGRRLRSPWLYIVRDEFYTRIHVGIKRTGYYRQLEGWVSRLGDHLGFGADYLRNGLDAIYFLASR